MSARGMSARGFRAFLLASMVLMGGFSTSYAETVKLKFDNPPTQWDGVTSTGGSAGRYNWDVVSKSGALATTLFPASRAWTFCIEQNQYISGGVTYEYTISPTLSGLPNPPGGPITAAIEKKLQALANLMSQVQFYIDYTSVIVQQTVWALVGGGSGPNATLNGQIAAMETYLSNPLNTATTKFFGLANGTGPNGEIAQDQIILGTVEGGGFGGSIVPVPTGVVMAGMGIVCLGGFNLLRRRKTVAAV